MRSSCRNRVIAGIALGLTLILYGLFVTACGGGSNTTAPTSVAEAPVAQAPAPAAPAPTPTPTPVPVAPNTPTAEYECSVSKFGYSITNKTKDTQRWQVYTTGFDEQHFATTAIPASGVQHPVAGGDTWADNPGFRCQQVDITQELTFVGQPGGRPLCFGFFDKDGKYFNTAYGNQQIADCRKCDAGTARWVEQEPEYGDWYDYVEPDSVVKSATEGKCYKTQRRKVTIYEINDCSKEKRVKTTRYETKQVEIPCPCVEPQTIPEVPGQFTWGEAILQGKCEVEQLPLVVGPASVVELNCHKVGSQTITRDFQCKADETFQRSLCQNVQCPCPISTAQLSLLTFPPITGFEYYQMNQGTDTARENACVNRGGVWLNTFNIPNDGQGDRSNVCRFPLPLPPGAPGADVTLLFRDASGGNPISGSAQFFSAGVWTLRLLAASSLGEYNSNSPDFVKDTKTVTLTCGGQGSASVSYNWVGHPSEYWWLEIQLNGAFYSKSAVVISNVN